MVLGWICGRWWAGVLVRLLVGFRGCWRRRWLLSLRFLLLSTRWRGCWSRGVCGRDVLAGYSVEYVAATVAGVMSWRDALSLVAFRARLIDRCPVGAMTAVSLPVARLRPLLGSGVDVAAVNAPGLCVMSGPVADVAEVERGLAAAQVAFRRLDTGHAFHSRMLLPVAQELTDWIRVNVRLAAPKIPYLSNVTGSWVRDDQALDPGYWAEHMCGPVRFADAAAELLADPDRVIVEIGPGQTLGAFIRQQPSCGASRMGLIIRTLPGQHEHVDSAETLHTAVARLWLAGVGIDWAGYHAGEARRRVPLPTYPFQRQRYWIDPPTTKRVPVAAAPRAEPDMAEGAGLQDILSALPRREIADWFYLPGWRQSAPPPPVDTAPDGLWLVFADGTGVGEALLDRLAGRGVRTVAVRPGADFAADRDGFVLRPGEQSHYARLLDAMGIDRTTRLTVVHLWSLDQAPIRAVGSASADPALDRS